MSERRSRFEGLVLLVALVYPSLLTLVYFVWLAGERSSLQQAAYGIGKAIQFVLPLVWVGLICREPLRWPAFSSRGLVSGIVFGLAIAGGMIGLYFQWLKTAAAFAAAAGAIVERLAGIGIRSAAAYAAMALFYSLLHSLLEEYYWRWFVFGRVRRMVSLAQAIVVSSVGFMCHHVIVLAWYFGWANPWMWFFSLATAVGGAFWAWLYHRSGSIYGPWASHLLIDAGIFAIGYELVRTTAQ